MKIGKKLNLEKSIQFGQKISGHFTQGHVDTTAKVSNIQFIDKTWVIKLYLTNKNFKKNIVEKDLYLLMVCP